MQETAAFLQNIRQQPHDDAPRLIFADWLEERGDPRGEFIRLQCLRSSFTIGDAHKLSLVEQEQALLKRHRGRWVGPLLQQGVGWEFRRGLLHLRVNMATFLRTDWEELTQTETWEWVETVGIRIEFRTDIEVYGTVDEERTIGTTIREQEARANAAIRRAFCAELQPLADSSSLARMEALDLRNNNLGDDGTAILAASPHVKGLRYLDLGFNRIGSMGCASIVRSPNLAELTTLKLDDNHIDDGAAWAMVAGAQPTQLVSLHLRWNAVGPVGARALAASPMMPHLATLHLGNNGIGDAGAEALAASTHLPRLTELHLEYNGVGAAGAAALRRRFGEGVHL
jgi:uncharacterized protein (TIGR02996 family)